MKLSRLEVEVLSQLAVKPGSLFAIRAQQATMYTLERGGFVMLVAEGPPAHPTNGVWRITPEGHDALRENSTNMREIG